MPLQVVALGHCAWPVGQQAPSTHTRTACRLQETKPWQCIGENRVNRNNLTLTQEHPSLPCANIQISCKQKTLLKCKHTSMPTYHRATIRTCHNSISPSLNHPSYHYASNHHTIMPTCHQSHRRTTIVHSMNYHYGDDKRRRHHCRIIMYPCHPLIATS